MSFFFFIIGIVNGNANEVQSIYFLQRRGIHFNRVENVEMSIGSPVILVTTKHQRAKQKVFPECINDARDDRPPPDEDGIQAFKRCRKDADCVIYSELNGRRSFSVPGYCPENLPEFQKHSPAYPSTPSLFILLPIQLLPSTWQFIGSSHSGGGDGNFQVPEKRFERCQYRMEIIPNGHSFGSHLVILNG